MKFLYRGYWICTSPRGRVVWVQGIDGVGIWGVTSIRGAKILISRRNNQGPPKRDRRKKK